MPPSVCFGPTPVRPYLSSLAKHSVSCKHPPTFSSLSPYPCSSLLLPLQALHTLQTPPLTLSSLLFTTLNFVLICWLHHRILVNHVILSFSYKFLSPFMSKWSSFRFRGALFDPMLVGIVQEE